MLKVCICIVLFKMVMVCGLLLSVCSSHCRLWGGPVVSQPLDVPPAVSSEWRNSSVYDRRLWGSYR